MYPNLEKLGVPVRWGYVTQFELERTIVRRVDIIAPKFFDVYDKEPGHSKLPFLEKAGVVEKVLEKLK